MPDIKVKAPGVVKLLGEHAVVYGRLTIAIGISIYATSKIADSKRERFTISLKDMKIRESFSREDLHNLYTAYKSKPNITNYIENNGEKTKLLPFATVAARLQEEYGLDLSHTSVKLSSKIPLQKGLASSAALSTAFTVSILKKCGKMMDDATIIDVARDGERIIHRNDNAGRIDVSTAFYGGYTSYSSEQGARKEEISKRIKLLIVDTGPKKSTAETVGHVAELHRANRETIEKILDEIDECSEKGISALKENRMKELGSLMYHDHELLKRLEVSNANLDRVVETAKEEGILGAKLSGGGGGGIAIALYRGDCEDFVSQIGKMGFSVTASKTSMSGAKDFL